jgi:sigma-B regulation protein RsbU (phosphoserine phosphatase)
MDVLRDGIVETIREELQDRRARLEQVLERRPEPVLLDLVRQVDAALERLDEGRFGLCEVCHGPIETERLLVNPLISTCLEDLSKDEQAALQRDLELVSQVQRKLLPPAELTLNGWEISQHYRPYRVASGDYCDVIPTPQGLYVLIGDVSGKGVAASMLVATLHGLFRTLLPDGCELGRSLERANRIFCESTVSSHYATLVCLAADESGELSVANAGHCAPFLVRENEVVPFESSGFPLGAFCQAQYQVSKARLKSGDSVFLYTDGLSEARNHSGEEYGASRMQAFLTGRRGHSARQLLHASLADLREFTSDRPPSDDLTVLCLRKM